MALLMAKMVREMVCGLQLGVAMVTQSQQAVMVLLGLVVELFLQHLIKGDFV
jgi:hypothetical protein